MVCVSVDGFALLYSRMVVCTVNYRLYTCNIARVRDNNNARGMMEYTN